MKTDIEISNSTELKDISEIARNLGIAEDQYEPYGRTKAKLSLDLLETKDNKPKGKLILVTAINPTPGGEGKTTMNIALSMALNKLGSKAISTLREPSLGPVFGMKGGAAGGGYSQVLPMEDINLHFTGDIHAITSAHNLLAALVDNHIQQGNSLGINPKKVVWNRVLDVNDRSLRNIVIGLGSNADGVTRESSFSITAASEIMAIFCLAENLADLKERLSRIIVAYNYDNQPVTCGDLEATEALAILLKDALKPNLVQTTENTPAIIHGGPFANIAHGCNTVIANKVALNLADYVVTEAGFGADLGAEKFFDIVSRNVGFTADAVVLVATVKALKYNGGVDKNNLNSENLAALEKGFANLKQHIENLQKYNLPIVVAINKFYTDTQAEIDLLTKLISDLGIESSVVEAFTKGSEGALDLARKVKELADQSADNKFKLLYPDDLSLEAKIETIAKEIYRASGVEFGPGVRTKLRKYEKSGLGKLPVCIAKTQYSFSDDPKKLCAPHDFKINIRDVELKQGAGFVVALAGNIMTMPGLPKVPAANNMHIAVNGEISGLS